MMNWQIKKKVTDKAQQNILQSATTQIVTETPESK